MIKDYGKLSFYEIYPITFKDSNGDGDGDIQGIIEKLDYVKSLGFSGIWFNPFYKSPFRDGGYDVSDPFHIDERFGGDEMVAKLVEACHQRELAVFFDLIPGHLSWDAPWFLRSAASQRNEDSDMFIWTNNPWEWSPSSAGNLVRGLFPRYGSFFVNFFVHQPALNYGFNRIDYPWQMDYRRPECAKARHFIAQIMIHWLKQGVDGFRVDMADSLVKNDDEKDATIWVWQQVREEVEKECGTFHMVSEWATPRRSLKATFDSDFVLDHDDNFSHAFFRQGTNPDNTREEGQAPLFVKFDQKLWDFAREEMLSEIRDAEKFPGRWLSVISGNHDTYRIADAIRGDALKLAYLTIFTLPGVPFVFAGDECEQTTLRGYPSKDGGYQRTGTRLHMRWDDSTLSFGFSSRNESECYLPSNPETRTVAACEKDPDSLLNFIRTLNALRLSDPDLTTHEGFELFDAPLSYRRGKTVVACNLKDEDLVLDLGEGETLLTIGGVKVENGRAVVPHHAGLVYRQK